MAGIRTENKIYEVGIYCRLSKDDGTDNESASIATQKSILTDYVKRQGWHLAKTYVDDGYSGTNFQRPSFQNMIKDIENGLINCVITKDLSRLGRNYLDCGLYLEVFFPEHNVRYIAVNDGVDTLNKSAMDITPFRNILTGNPYIKEKMDLDIQVSKLKLMKANHTSQKYRLEDNIAKHYPQQITILKERISGLQADIQTAKANLPADKELFSMKVGNKVYTDKKEAGTALVEMCKEIKSVNAPAAIGEYAGFKMAVSFDSFNHKFVMNIKGQLSHNLEIGVDPLGNISRINHALEAMTKELAEASTKLENVERQLETAKVEVTKPFAQEAELSEKLDRLSALNALLNMDEKGDDGIGMEDDKSELGTEQVADTRKPYPIENTRHNYAVENGNPQGMRLTAAMADKPAQRVSLKEKLETMKVKAAGNNIENSVQRDKGKEEYL